MIVDRPKSGPEIPGLADDKTGKASSPNPMDKLNAEENLEARIEAPQVIREPFSGIFDSSREVYVVVTGSDMGSSYSRKYAEIARWVSDIVKEDRDVNARVVAARTQQEAAEVYRAFGYLPVVLFLAETKSSANSGLLHLESALDILTVTELTDPLKVVRQDGRFDIREPDSISFKEFQASLKRHRDDMRHSRGYVFSRYDKDALDSIVQASDLGFDDVREYIGLGSRLPSLIKIGGSIFDIARYGGELAVFENTLKAIKELYDMGYKFVLTVGGGPLGDSEAAIRASGLYSDPDSVIRTQIGRLSAELKRVCGLESRAIKERWEFETLLSVLYDKGRPLVTIPIIQSIPRGLANGEQGVPPRQSDAVSIVAAAYFQLPNVVYVKDTPGVFGEDPKRPGQATMLFYPRIFSDQVISRISRTAVNPADGNMTPGHLIDDEGLRKLTDSRNPFGAYVKVVNGRDPAAIKAAVTGIAGNFSYILK